uniref:DOG1 domain-containing protein n=1 Tax=Kalanchoe fedtschenkoi TaxID=63787 RepID=A0A7N0RDP6_KALFE
MADQDGDHESSSSHDRSHTCFRDWINLQKSDLDQLVKLLNPESGVEEEEGASSSSSSNKHFELCAKTVSHFEDYMRNRAELAREDISIYFAPSWCTTLENSLLWIAGCRPSMFIRLVYALCGSEMERNLSQFLLQGTSNGLLGDLSAGQLSSVNMLQLKTVREEEKLTSRLATLQEDIADQPLAVIARGATQVGETSEEADKALDDHERSMANILEEADKIRLKTLKELLGILTPKQGVDFLVASKKLHLSLHEWGKKRDRLHGRHRDARKPPPQSDEES